MARRPAARLQDLVDHATAVFIAQGYRRTQIADIADALGVAKGTVYLYVESKAALFDLVLRAADAPRPLAAPPALPIRTPPPGATLRYIRTRLAAAKPTAPILAAAQRRVADIATELDRLLRELYASMAAHRTGITLLDRCAADYPELARLWFTEGREAVVAAFAHYLEIRRQEGELALGPDVGVTARLLVETIVFWAVHRHWDPAPQPVEEAVAEASVVRLLTNALLGGPSVGPQRADRRTDVARAPRGRRGAIGRGAR
jgi:AcrR family transcriptional regulator